MLNGSLVSIIGEGYKDFASCVVKRLPRRIPEMESHIGYTRSTERELIERCPDSIIYSCVASLMEYIFVLHTLIREKERVSDVNYISRVFTYSVARLTCSSGLGYRCRRI